MKNAKQHPLRSAWLAALVLGMTSLATAHASTVTYNFTQSGWDDGGTLTGTFTGTPEAGGVIQLADLTNFSASFHLTVGSTPNTFNFTAPTAFTYDPTSGDILEFSSGSAASQIELCSGGIDTNVACYGISLSGPVRVNSVGFFEDLPNFAGTNTHVNALVTQVQAGPTATAEPATLLLVATAGVFFVYKAKRSRIARRLVLRPAGA